MNIDEMPAGEEMNKLVATQVMDFHLMTEEERKAFDLIICQEGGMYYTNGETWICDRCDGFADYSTEIAPAWQAGETFTAKTGLYINIFQDPSCIYEVRFGTWFDPWGFAWGRSDAVSLAICRAILKGVKGGDTSD